MITRAEMTSAELATVKGPLPAIDAAVLEGMEQTAHTPLPRIKKSQVLAAIDYFVASCHVLLGLNHAGESLQTLRGFIGGAEQFRSPSQP